MNARTAPFGIDIDRACPREPIVAHVRRRLTGRYPVDAFGADPLLQDAVAPWAARLASAEVEGAAYVPELGPAVLVCSRRVGAGDPFVVQLAVRQIRRRRARIAGYPDLPVAGGIARRLGAIRSDPHDVAAALRSGHLVIVPLAPSWSPRRAGPAPVPVLAGAVGYPVLPVAVTGGLVSVAGTGVGRHRVVVGAPLDIDAVPGDPLGVAEIAEAARGAVARLLEDGGSPTKGANASFLAEVPGTARAPS